MNAERILGLLAAADGRAGELTLLEVAALLGVAPDKVADAISTLATVGVAPLCPEDLLDVTIEGDWVLVEAPPSLAAPLWLSPVDSAVLTACLRTLAATSTGPVAQLCERAISRLRAGSDVDRKSAAITWHVEERFDPATLATLQRAVDERREVVLTYYSGHRDAVSTRRVRPVVLVQHSLRWYVDALGEDGQIRHFRVDRVLTVEVTDVRFEVPAVDAKEYRREILFDAPTEMVTVEIDVDLPVVERVLARMRGVEAVVRGPERARVTVRGANLPGILRVLFAAGPGWEVVGPEAARQLVRDWVRAA